MRLFLFRKSYLFLFPLWMLVQGCQKATPSMIHTTPADSTVPSYSLGSNIQDFNEGIDGSKESIDRLRQGFIWSDFEPTGYYLPPNTSLTLNVAQLAGAALPKLLIGTYSFDTLRWNPRSEQLTAGDNAITADQYGGLLWIRFTTTGTPAAKVRITFKSGAVRAPVFVKDQTTDWAAQLNQYTQSPAAILANNTTYLVFERSRALSTSNADANFILQTIDKGVEKGENYIAGMDNSTPENAPPTHKILMTVSNAKNIWGVASSYRTWFAPGLLNEALTAKNITDNGWGAWHELGHLHQQQAWKWSTLGEVTVNIYTLAAERAVNGAGALRLKGTPTTNAMNFLAIADTSKDFNSDAQMTDGNFTRLFMFHQLWLAFGDSFYITLHKQTRAEKPNLSTDADKMRYFMLKACTISGKNLTTFFKKWGFKPGASVYTEIANLGLPQPAVEPSTLKDN
ncbi:MAG: M60 family metallopeptidase [Niabella sp.]|nr:M60 family metallopeptidase [Niabella sp.]